MNDKMQVAQSEKEEEQILELDRDKLYLVTDTFSSASMYLNSKLQHGYLGLNGPDLYSFQLPHPDVQHNGVTEVQDNFDILYNWEKENAYEINMIEPEDEQKLGVLQHDLETGELYMLLPLEIDVLLQPDDDIDLLTCSIPQTQLHLQSDELNSSINDPKKKACIDLDSDNLIGLTNDSSTDTYTTPASDLPIELHRTKADAEPQLDNRTKLAADESFITLGAINLEEKLSQETLTQEAEPPDIVAPEDAPDADADGAIRSICDVLVPKMSLKFSLSFNFDEICINPKDYERRSLFRNRNIYNAAEMHKQGDKQGDKQSDRLIDNNEQQVMDPGTINNIERKLATKADGEID